MPSLLCYDNDTATLSPGKGFEAVFSANRGKASKRKKRQGQRDTFGRKSKHGRVVKRDAFFDYDDSSTDATHSASDSEGSGDVDLGFLDYSDSLSTDGGDSSAGSSSSSGSSYGSAEVGDVGDNISAGDIRANDLSVDESSGDSLTGSEDDGSVRRSRRSRPVENARPFKYDSEDSGRDDTAEDDTYEKILRQLDGDDEAFDTARRNKNRNDSQSVSKMIVLIRQDFTARYMDDDIEYSAMVLNKEEAQQYACEPSPNTVSLMVQRPIACVREGLADDEIYMSAGSFLLLRQTRSPWKSQRCRIRRFTPMLRYPSQKIADTAIVQCTRVPGFFSS